MNEQSAYHNHEGILYGATIAVGDVVENATVDRYGASVAFIRDERGSNTWRTIEWFTVPQEVKDALFRKAIAKHERG